MSQKWEYVTIIINPDSYSLMAVNPDHVKKGRKGADGFIIMAELGKEGWELVTSFNAGSSRALNLVFKRAMEG